MEIRDAVPEDWPKLWPFMKGIVRAGETYTYPADASEDDIRAMWMATGLPNRTLVAADGDTVLGTAKMGPNHLGAAAHIGTASFMVAPEHAGRGVGRALGEYVVAQSKADGFRGIQFNAVVETNSRAVALWQSLGFEILATLPGGFRHPEKGYVGLHIMFRNLVA